MAYDNTNFYGDLIVSEYDDKGNFMTPQTPTGYYVYHILGDGFDLMSEMCNQFMNDYSILTASPKSLDNFWRVSYNMPRPSLPYLYTVLFEDVGTVQSHNDNWVKQNPNNFTITRGEEYTSLTGSNYRYGVPINNNCKIKVETRRVSSSGNLLSIWSYISNPLSASQLLTFSVTEMGMTQGTFSNLEMTVTPTTVTVTNLDNGTTITKEYNTTYNLIFNFWGTTFDYKNFRIEGIVYPNIYFDDATTDTNSRYYINTGGGTSLTWNNGYLVLTLGSSSRYVKLRTSQYDVNNLIGKKIHFEAEINADTSAYVQLLDDTTGTVYRRANGNEVTTGISQLEYTIPSNCTEVLFQIMAKDQSASGGTIKFKNFKIYTMENPIYSTRLMTDEEYKIYLYLRNCRLMTREDIEINMNKCFATDDYNIFFATETNYLSVANHLNYNSKTTEESNLAKNDEDTSLNFITNFANDEDTLLIESGLSEVEEVIEVINVPSPNGYDPAFLELLENYISVKGNLKIKEYSI